MIKEKTTLQPGKPRSDQYGIETLRIAISDIGMLHVTFDNQTGTMRLICHNYGDTSKKLALVHYDRDGVTLKF